MNYFFLMILFVFTSIYFYGLPVNPVYIIFTFVSLIYACLRPKLRLNKAIMSGLIYMIYIIINSIINKSYYSLNVIFSLLCFFLIYELSVNLTINQLIRISERFIDSTILFFLIESIIRLQSPMANPAYDGSLYFYKFKFNSIAFQDSNFVGFLLTIVYFFCLYLDKKTKKTRWFRETFLVFLIFLTLSRSSILVVIIGSFIYSRIISLKLKKILSWLLFIPTLSFIIYYILNDSSCIMKFGMISNLIDYLSKMFSIKLFLLGVGLGETSKYLGLGSHILYVTNIFETGIIGTILYYFFICCISLKYLKNNDYITIPYLLLGCSLAPHYTPYMFAIYAVCISLEYKTKSLLRGK